MGPMREATDILLKIESLTDLSRNYDDVGAYGEANECEHEISLLRADLRQLLARLESQA